MSAPAGALPQAADFRAECDALNALLERAPESAWQLPTQFKGWTFEDVLGHLHLFDLAALATFEASDGFERFLAPSRDFRAAGGSLREYTRQWLGERRGRVLLAAWYRGALALEARVAGADPAQRVNWGPGPSMSLRSLVSARQMETWAHGQAIFDALGVVRVEADRLRNIAIMGVNTFGWSFLNRKLAVPAVKPYVRLTAPSGAMWEWNDPDPRNAVEGAAVEFCQVVTQTRSVADTQLRLEGDTARRWMAIAQCFAGPPEPPPAPGSRQLQR